MAKYLPRTPLADRSSTREPDRSASDVSSLFPSGVQQGCHLADSRDTAPAEQPPDRRMDLSVRTKGRTSPRPVAKPCTIVTLA